MKYFVTEIQVYDGGGVSTPTTAHDSLNAANAKYHQVLASAAVSKLPVHAAIMYVDEGYAIKGECFKHGEEAQSDG